MKQYIIDELRPEDQEKIKQYLDDHFGPVEMGTLYWIPLDPSLYSETQATHSNCHPLYFVVQLRASALVAELLVRTKNSIRCDCICYANNDQFMWLMHYVDSIFERLEIIA
jgi:hypothetical protein